MEKRKDRGHYDIDQLLRDVDAWQRIDKIPDSMPLSAKQAAVLMTFSERTLQEWRRAGKGPAYTQGGELIQPGGNPPPEATNSPIRYFKPAIADWWRKNMKSSVREAERIEARGFVASIQGLARDAPFYVDPLGQIEGAVEDGTLGELLDDVDRDIQWLPAVDAASCKWSDLERHRAFAEKVQDVLASARIGIANGVESTEIASATREGRRPD